MGAELGNSAIENLQKMNLKCKNLVNVGKL